jgi:hypothetical protein
MYRPTTLRLASAHCPRAIDYYERKRPRFHEVFQAGIAAHECVASVGAWAAKHGAEPDAGTVVHLCEETARQLITAGRAFDGQPEPPMRAEDAYEGRDLAIAYATEEATVWPVKDVWVERGVAFDANWRPVGYNDPARRFRLIPDCMALIDDGGEDYSGRLVLVRDYKTAWNTDASELDTVQMRGQAVAAYLLHGQEVDGVRREVVNLRTRQTFYEDTWLELGGRDQIEGWRADVTRYMDALDRMRDPQTGLRPLRPGAGCLSCPWAANCEAPHPMAAEAAAMAQRLAQLDGERAGLVAALKDAAAVAPLPIEGGAVGWQRTQKQEPKPDAAMQMFAEWCSKGGDINGFLAALKPGMTSLQAIAKKLHADQDERDRCLAAWSQTKAGREFGTYRSGQ